MIRAARSVLDEALFSLASHPLRSVLTALTVAFGTAVLVVLLAYGHNAPEATAEVLRQLGSTQIKVSPGRSRGPGGTRTGREIRIRYDDLDAVRQACPSLAGLAPGFYPSRGEVVYGPDRSWPWASIQGVGHEYLGVADLSMLAGRWFTSDEEQARREVAILNRPLAEGLFAGDDPIGEWIDILARRFEVIGVLNDPNAFSYSLYVPYTASMGMGGKSGRTVDWIVVRPRRADLAAEALREVRLALGTLYGFDPADESALRVEEQAAFVRQVNLVSAGLQGLVTTIAAIALVLGCLGAANVVGITVAERTAEIGLRKALGATPMRIRAEVFAESLLLCVGGGGAGALLALVAVSLLGPLRISETIDIAPELDPRLLLGGLVVLALAGVFAGVPAARRAAQLDAAEGLRG